MTPTFAQNDNFIDPGQFKVSFCEFAQLYINYSLSQLEINRVIQESTEVNYNTFRLSEAFYERIDWVVALILFLLIFVFCFPF